MINGSFSLLIILSVLTNLLSRSTVAQDANGFIKYKQLIPGVDNYIEMVPIQEGNYTIEDIKIELSSFWIAKFEITWDQYKEFEDLHLKSLNLIEGDSQFDGFTGPTQPYIDMSFGMGKKGYPAINITHYAATQYCKWLTLKTGIFFRLPTEAEWELACNGSSGSSEINMKSISEYAWYSDNSKYKYHKVGEKSANSFGLFDMIGNVAEWTSDQYFDNYQQKLIDEKITKDPYFKPDKLYPRTVRGGSWKDSEENLGCNARRPSGPNWKRSDPQLPRSYWWLTNAEFVGFRIVRPLHPPDAKEWEEFWPKAVKDL